jgi:hypothetical protein
VDKKDLYKVSGLKICQVEHDGGPENQSGLKFTYVVLDETFPRIVQDRPNVKPWHLTVHGNQQLYQAAVTMA